jgi:protoporphyrinogen oxidase
MSQNIESPRDLNALTPDTEILSDEPDPDPDQDAVVILGAGPAGLACAYQILKDAPRRKVVIVDQAPFVGGAGASFEWNGHTLDYGPHAFHTRGSEPEQLVRDIFSDAPDLLVEGHKLVHVYLKGKLLKYPLQVREALLKFNVFISIRIVFEFILTSLFHAAVSIPITSFESWGKKRFGPTLYKLSFGDYTEKVWKTRADKISEKFASEKIQGFNFIGLIRRLFRIGGQVTEPYYQTWVYPKFGAGKLYESLGQHLESQGVKFQLATRVKSLDVENGSVKSVRLERAGDEKVVRCAWLVNTVPLPHFVLMLGCDIPFSVRYAASQLRYISLILVYLEFDLEKVSDDHWFYLLDPKFRCNRVTEQKNLSASTMAPGKTVLSFELTCRVGDEYWRKSDEELYQIVLNDCANIEFMKPMISKIAAVTIKRVPHVYEIYFKDFDKAAATLLEYTHGFSNVSTIGRRGLFLQGDQHQSVEMGLEMGKLIGSGGPSEEQIRGFVAKHVKYVDEY